MSKPRVVTIACVLLLFAAGAWGQQAAAPEPHAAATAVQAAPQQNQPPSTAPAASSPPTAPQAGAAAGEPTKVVVPAPAAPRPTVLLAYWPPQAEAQDAKPYLDAIAVVDGTKLIDPWSRTSDVPGEVNPWIPHFDRRFFPKGRSYDVYAGGQRVATATVLRPEAMSCDGLSAAVKVTGTAPARKALATGRALESHAKWQKPLTDAQQQALLELARAALGHPGAAGKLIPENEVATQLEEHGPVVLAGDFTAGTRRAFLIAEAQHGGGYKAVVSNVHDVKDEDAKDEQHEEFLDQLDVTGDGRDEILTIRWYYESWDYSIYRRNAKGAWESVYHGGGGGC